jgi:precorrin-6Y C5,15-methyltransferase (decarboxylating)
MSPEAWLTVVGVGEDGYEGLGRDAREALARAAVLLGSARQLALVPPAAEERIAWPTPMLPFVERLIAQRRGERVVMLASGDPMLHGLGSVVMRLATREEVRVIPVPSAFAFACARLGWAESEVVLCSAVAKPLALVRRELAPGRRIVVYGENGESPAALARELTDAGYGPSALHVFERLGGPHEARRDGIAAAWSGARCNDLNVAAIECRLADGARALSTLAGLPDDAFASDGALTKREVRAATLAALAPLPGELLWDVGAGSGSIGIEWSRAHPSCRAVAFERDPVRAQRIVQNARALGVPTLHVVVGDAPATFVDAGPTPDAIFIGGGVNADAALIETCWNALAPGGRLVANVVTVAGEAALANAYARHGGALVRIAVARADAVGGVVGWRPAMPVTQWSAVKA